MLSFALVFIALSFGVISQLINNEQPTPYMDEVFHIPQVQQYCRHNFSHWDNMITTLPGLYISSILWTTPLQLITGIDFCTVQYLRAQNILFTCGCFIVIYHLLKSLHPNSSFSILSPLSLTFFPLTFFFSFLYYTDNGSTLLVLTGYLLAIKKYHISSSMVLMGAILFRQTSIVWAGFVAGTVALKIISPHLKKGGLRTQFFSLFNGLFSSFPVLFFSLLPYIVLAVSFCLFIIVNGGIVVGDKTHHVASFHLPQFLYFVSFSCLFSVGPLLSNWRILKKLLFDLLKPKYILSFVGLTVGSLIIVHYYTYEHPYLLADNRHYPFYVWKNIFKSNLHMKYYVTPFYSLSIIMLATVLAEKQSKLWILLFVSSCFISLVPQALLEFRYYIIPYLLYRLHTSPSLLIWGSVLECVHYCCINAITVWLFVKRPFKWNGQDELQRFMW